MSINLRELADLPHGQAAKVIRRVVDPAWGLGGEGARTWFVNVTTWGCDCYLHSECCTYNQSFKTYEIEAVTPEDAAAAGERQANADKLGEVAEIDVSADKGGPPIKLDGWRLN